MAVITQRNLQGRSVTYLALRPENLHFERLRGTFQCILDEITKRHNYQTPIHFTHEIYFGGAQTESTLSLPDRLMPALLQDVLQITRGSTAFHKRNVPSDLMIQVMKLVLTKLNVIDEAQGFRKTPEAV